MDILKELFGTSDELQISKSLFGSDAPSTSVELGLEHPFSIPSRDNLPRPLPLLPEPRPSHSQPFLARSHSLDDLHSGGSGGVGGAEDSENLGGYRHDSLRAQSVFPHLSSNAPSSHVYLHNVPHEMPMYLLEEDEGNDEEIMRLLETTTDSLSTSGSTRSGGDGRTDSDPVFQDERTSLPAATEAAGENAASSVGETTEESNGEGKGYPLRGRTSSEVPTGEGAELTCTNLPLLEVSESDQNSESVTLPQIGQEPFSLHVSTASQDLSATPSPSVFSTVSSPAGVATPPSTGGIPATCDVTSVSTAPAELLPSSLIPPPPPPPPLPPPQSLPSPPVQSHSSQPITNYSVPSSAFPHSSVTMDTIVASLLPLRDEGTQTLHNTALGHNNTTTIPEIPSLPLSSSAGPLGGSLTNQPQLTPAQLLAAPLMAVSIAVSLADSSSRQQGGREVQLASIAMPTSSSMQRIQIPSVLSNCHFANAAQSSAAVISVPSPAHLPLPNGPSINLAPTFLPVAVPSPRAHLPLALPTAVQQSIEKLKEQVMIQGQRLEEALKNILPVQEPPPNSGRESLSMASSTMGSHGCSPTNTTSPPSISSVSPHMEVGASVNGDKSSSNGRGHGVTHMPTNGASTTSVVAPLPHSPREAEVAAPSHQVSPIATCSVATQVTSPPSKDGAEKQVSPVSATPGDGFEAETGLSSGEGEVRVQGDDFVATPDEGGTPMEGEEVSTTDTSCSGLSLSPVATSEVVQLVAPSHTPTPTPLTPLPLLPATASPPVVDRPIVSIATSSPDPAHEVTITTDSDLTTNVDTDKHTPSPKTRPVETAMEERGGQPGPTPSSEEARVVVCVEHQEDMEVEEGGEPAGERSPTPPQQPSHCGPEEINDGEEGRDHSPCCHGDVMQHDLTDSDITRCSPGHPDQPRPPTTTTSSLPPDTMTPTISSSSNCSPSIATSSIAPTPGVTTTACPTPTPSVVLPGLSLPPSFSLCVPSMNWRAQSFAKVFGLNALPIKLLPSKGGQGTQVGGGSGRQVDEVRKEGRTKRKRNGGGWPKGKKRKVKPKATPPKPPATAYGLFLSEQRQAVTERHTFKSMAQLSRKIGRMWGETSDDQKQVYYERASKDRQRYLEDLKTYISEIHKENSAESLEKVNSVLTQCLENEENNDLLVCHICQTSFITLHNKRSHYTGKMHTDMLWEQLNKLLGDASKTTSAKTTNSSTEGTTIKKRKRKSVCCHGDGDQDDPNRDGLARAGSGDEGQSQTELEVEPSCNGHTPGQDTVMEGVVSGGSATPPASGSPPLRGGSEEFCNDPTLTGGQSAEELSQEVEVSVADSPGCGRGGSCDVVEAKDVPDDNFAQNDVQCTSVSTNGAEQSDPQAVPSDDTTTEPLNVPTATNQSCQPVMSCDTPAGEGCHGDSHVPQSLQQWAQSYTDLLEELEERRASHCSNLEHYSKLQAQDEAKESALTFLLDEFRSEERALTDCINKLLHTLQRIATS